MWAPNVLPVLVLFGYSVVMFMAAVVCVPVDELPFSAEPAGPFSAECLFSFECPFSAERPPAGGPARPGPFLVGCPFFC